MPDFYICDQAEVRAKLKTLYQESISEDGWTHFYKDETRNEQWILTSYQSERNGGGLLLLKKLPGLSTEEIIDTALTSNDKNDIVGATFDLMIREETKQKDFRIQLIEKLKAYIKSELSTYDKERVRLIINQCELTDIRNRREVIGKHFSEIEKDAAYFRTISAEATQILVSLDDKKV